ncbi:MAG: hypothetical protein KGS45_06510 [Planctomycetes bacterium]|nr:hypothetical protein [Planctomycetota bacterium]
MLLPPYMAAVGLNAFRGPGTWIGDLIEKGVLAGWTSLPIWVGKGIAGVGLALWVLPLAAAIVGAQLRSVDQGVVETLRLEPLGRWQRGMQWLRLLRPGLLQAWLACAVLMCGSAVPLHVAQVNTLAIAVWKVMDQTAVSERGALWLATWPFMLISLAVGVSIWRMLRTQPVVSDVVVRVPPRSHGERAAGLLIWACAAFVPVLIALWSVDSAAALRSFWRVSGVAMRDSGVIALCSGIAICGLAVWCAWRGSTTWVRIVTATMVAAGVFPGMLIGVLMATISRGLDVEGTVFAAGWVVLVHVLRFGWIGCVVGVFLARSEPQSQRDHRLLDGAGSFTGWVKSCVGWQWGGMVAAGLAGVAMSFCEIEATIFVQPPELESLPRQMLGHLHFSRTSELGAASFYVGVVMLGIAAVAGVLATWVVNQIQVSNVPVTKPDQGKSQP